MTWLKLLIAVTIVVLAGFGAAMLMPEPPVAESGPEPSAATVRPRADSEPPRDAGLVLSTPLPRPNRLSEALCPEGMAWLSGEYCAPGFVTEAGCRVAAPLVEACIDLFEYPNREGAFPAVMVTVPEARAACASEGKRLCRDAEWTLACRGTHSTRSCQFGASKPSPRRERLWDPWTTSSELSRVDGRRMSRQSGCVGASGVFDLPGNVEEWVEADHSGGYPVARRGGHFNRGSIGCERSVFSREIHVRSPYAGFRCCADPLVEPPESAR